MMKVIKIKNSKQINQNRFKIINNLNNKLIILKIKL